MKRKTCWSVARKGFPPQTRAWRWVQHFSPVSTDSACHRAPLQPDNNTLISIRCDEAEKLCSCVSCLAAFHSHWIQFLFHSKFSPCTSRQQKTGWHHWPLWTLHPHPHLQSQSLDHQPSIHPSGQLFSLSLSLGTRLHYRDELSYCEDPTAPFCGRGLGLAGHRGIVRWPGFRGQFTHCLKSISRNASLDDRPPPLLFFFSAEGPLTATPGIRALQPLM